jgi:hypothetical protein
MFQNVSKCFKMFQNVSKCFKMFQNISKCFKMFLDFLTVIQPAVCRLHSIDETPKVACECVSWHGMITCHQANLDKTLLEAAFWRLLQSFQLIVFPKLLLFIYNTYTHLIVGRSSTTFSAQLTAFLRNRLERRLRPSRKDIQNNIFLKFLEKLFSRNSRNSRNPI